VPRLPPVVPLVVAGVALALVPALRLPAFYESFLEQGRIVAEGAPSELALDARIRETYLGQQ
jgi:ABC-type branched-subunit amino acid transport system ATPase component